MGTDRQPADSYDVAILGGGLAGLTLGIQLKQARPETTIFIAEKETYVFEENPDSALHPPHAKEREQSRDGG